ncbi:MAG TPA: CapA family protein, partial [Limnobacter sp.]|nr:CapA family protein [Limnobacter sp.]
MQGALHSARACLMDCLARHAPRAGLSQAVLALSCSDGQSRAQTLHWVSGDFAQAWARLQSHCEGGFGGETQTQVHWRVDAVVDVEALTWGELKHRLSKTKRNYFRMGVALDDRFEQIFLDMELNANAMLVGSSDQPSAQLNVDHFNRVGKAKYGSEFFLNHDDATPVWVFKTCAVYWDSQHPVPHVLHVDGPHAGSRIQPNLDADSTQFLIEQGSGFLARQVLPNGRFVYGMFPCFDREVPGYNTLRHASTVYAMLEAWEVNRQDDLKAAIERALACLTEALVVRMPLPGVIPTQEVAFLLDSEQEIKLGGNAVAILALCKYTELTGDTRHLHLAKQLAHGIAAMFNPQTGQFVHVLNYPALSVKQAFRIIYYDGEASFALLRLYKLTRMPAYLQIVVRAFDHFIEAGYEKAHDHWLSYSVNELTIHKPQRKYFEFGVRNFSAYLDFVLERITTFPTLLELMMAAEQMLQRMRTDQTLLPLLAQVDLEKFYRALHHRANYLRSGFFWPEWAMFYKNPARVAGGFFIRHHAYRVRIDDVEHYLSGLVAYKKFLLGRKPVSHVEVEGVLTDSLSACPTLAWGGDVNLGRRMHRRLSEWGPEAVLQVDSLRRADYAVVNLECVVALQGEQGVDKGEGGPYYFRARPPMLEVLQRAGVDAVVCANNHSGDYGIAALLEQQHWLCAAKLAHAGCGQHAEDAWQALLVDVKNIRLAIVALDTTQPRFAAGTNHGGTNFVDLKSLRSREQEIRQRFEALREQADLLILAVHWGENHATEPSELIRRSARCLVDWGADAILGASAHVLHGMEVYCGAPVIYDAGDLLFDARDDAKGKPGGVFTLYLAREGVVAVEMSPLRVGYGQTRQIKGAEAQSQLTQFSRQCEKLGAAVVRTRRDTLLLHVGASRSTFSQMRFVEPRAPLPAMSPARFAHFKPALAEVMQQLVVDHVPADCAVDPIDVGPLRLLGIRVSPARLTERGMVWVETFWCCAAPVAESLLLDFQAVPMQHNSMPPLGLGSDHEPGDWRAPTNTWKPGITYRDRYGLRPPPRASLQSGSLGLTVRVLGQHGVVGGFSIPSAVELCLPNPAAPSANYSRLYRSVDLPARSKPEVVWTPQELLAVTGGRWLVPPGQTGWHVNGVVRALAHTAYVGEPCLYVASTQADLAFHEMRSANDAPSSNLWDRHTNLAGMANSFAGAMVEYLPPGMPADFPLLQVPDPIKALMDLGATARKRMRGKVVAITGSAGKSSTVALLQHVARGALKTGGSYDNYNSRVGALVCLASLPANTELAVIETAVTAINAPAYLPIRLVNPDVAVITNIAASHLKPGETLDHIARRKANVCEGMAPGAILVVNRDDAYFEYFRQRAQQAQLRLVSVGEHAQSDVRLLQYTAANGQVSASVFGKPMHWNLKAPGKHMAINACFAVAALALVREEVLQNPAVLDGFSSFLPQDGRGNRLPVVVNGQAVTLINESYNANPLSMRAALDALATCSE